MENVFDALCSSLAEPENKRLFLDSEGVDLMVLMMKCVLAEFSSITSPDFGLQGEETGSVQGN
jgi:beta-catenin-like protein 1